MTEGSYWSAPLNQGRGGGAAFCCWLDDGATPAYGIYSSVANGTGNLSLIRLSDDMVINRWMIGDGADSSEISAIQAAALAFGQAVSGK